MTDGPRGAAQEALSFSFCAEKGHRMSLASLNLAEERRLADRVPMSEGPRGTFVRSPALAHGRKTLAILDL